MSVNLEELFIPYNPWWDKLEQAFEVLPVFKRPIFSEVYQGIKTIPQIISITGPRRVGKSTLIKQIVRELISEATDPHDIWYYSMDDPALLRSSMKRDLLFDSVMEQARKRPRGKPLLFFLDEIQKFENWELFIKKFFDLQYPVRWLVSGSASSPIMRKSRESLLGRIKDYHLLPFSFREYLLFQNKDNVALASQYEEIYHTGKAVMGMFTKQIEYAEMSSVPVAPIPDDLRPTIQGHLNRFLLEGGFPEVWTLPDWAAKQSYLFDNHVEKVISEDLILATELRKPEALKRFYISLLEQPGREINFQKLSVELKIPRQSIEKYFPLLEMTDLTRRVEKFSKSPLKVRRGNIKCYLVDLALRNAVMRIQDKLFEDESILGKYAENLVFNALKKWEGALHISYFREKNYEIDFIVHARARTFIPFEVKYRAKIEDRDLSTLRNFCRRFKCPAGLVVTKQWEDFGDRQGIFFLPLPHFLLLWD